MNFARPIQCGTYGERELVFSQGEPALGHSLVRIALATTGDVVQQKPIGSKPI